MIRSSLTLIVSVAALLSIASCGGGGGGSNFKGAGRIDVSVSPSQVDLGDRVEVDVMIADAHPDGIFVKIRHPAALSYVAESAVLEIDGDEFTINPSYIDTSDEDYSFLFFSLENSIFKNTDKAIIRFEARADTEVSGFGQKGIGQIEADIDVLEDVTTSVQVEEFDVEDSAQIEVL
ncbi:MAG: hypothetical protein KDD53_05810 [Bdellovibrionales bacterium]|nr:hypothetical protein [Bdellovibrionales bacterium]